MASNKIALGAGASETALAASDGYPINMDTLLAAQYLRDQHGIPITPKTMQNWRSARKGPAPKYLGAKPYYSQGEPRPVREDASLERRVSAHESG